MSINVSATSLEKISFFLPVFRISIAVIETFPILSNPSSHGPARYVRHRMGSFAYASRKRTRARRLSLRAKTGLSRNTILSQSCALSQVYDE